LTAEEKLSMLTHLQS